MDEVTLRQVHDDLVANTPDGVNHDAASCPLCAPAGAVEPFERGEFMSEPKTFTQAEVDAAVLEALKPIQSELETFKASQEAAAVEQRIAEVKSEHDEQITKLQSELDTATLTAEQAKKEYDDLVAYLEGENAELERLAEIARCRDERLVIVREAASFSDEYIEKAADRWASLTDEEFAALVDDWKAISKKETATTTTTTDLPAKTAMVASREQQSDTRSALRDVMDLTLQRVPLNDLR